MRPVLTWQSPCLCGDGFFAFTPRNGGPMPTQKKIETVADLKDRIERATIIVSSGVPRPALSRRCRTSAASSARAASRSRSSRTRFSSSPPTRPASGDLTQIVEGPTALAIAYGDIIDAAKAITAYAQGAPQAFRPARRRTWTAPSSRERPARSDEDPAEARAARAAPRPLQSPLANFVGLMESPLRELHGLRRRCSASSRASSRRGPASSRPAANN